MADYDLLPIGNNQKKKKTLKYDEALSLLGGAKPPASGVLSRVGDAGLDLAKGIVGAGEATIGLGDIVTGGSVGKLLQDYASYDPKRAKSALSDNYSVARQQANQEVENASGFVGTTAAMLKNPSTIAGTVLESAPSMIGGGGYAQTLSKAGILTKKPIARGAIGEGMVSGGQNAEQIRQETADGLLTPKQSLASLASGITTGVIGFGGGKLAQKMGILDPQTLLAGGYPLPNGLSRQTLGKVGKGFISEGVLQELPQSATEQMWQNYAQDKSLMEGVPEAAATGLLAGGVMGAGTNLIHNRGRHQQTQTDQQSPSSTIQDAPTNPPLSPTDQLLLGHDNLNSNSRAHLNPNLTNNYDPVITGLQTRANQYGMPSPNNTRPTGAISKALFAGVTNQATSSRSAIEGELVDELPTQQWERVDEQLSRAYREIEPEQLQARRQQLIDNGSIANNSDLPALYAPNSRAKQISAHALRDMVRNTSIEQITPNALMRYSGSNYLQATKAIQAIKQEQHALNTDFSSLTQANNALKKLTDQSSFEVARLANSKQWLIVPKEQQTPVTTLPSRQPLTKAEQVNNQAQYEKQQRQLKRSRINPEKDSLIEAVIKLGGISPEYKLDTTGDTQGNKSIVGVGYLWSHKNGTSIDDVARRLADEGYIPTQEINNYDGVRWLQEAIADELAGRKKHYSLNSEKHHAQQYEAYLQNRLEQEQAVREQEYANIRQQQGFEAEQQARFYDEQASNYFKHLEEQHHELERQTNILDGEPITETDTARINDQLRQYDERVDQTQRTTDRETQASTHQQEKIKVAEPTKNNLTEELTALSEADLSALFDEIASETKAVETDKPLKERKRRVKQKQTTTKRTVSNVERTDTNNQLTLDRTASRIAKDIGVDLSRAGKNAVKGLAELFGGKGKLSSGLTFDEQTYAKAKPHFVAMLNDFQSAGKNLRDFLRAVLDNFGTGVKPYVMRFAQDIKEGNLDVSDASVSMERDSEHGGVKNATVPEAISDETTRTRSSTGESSKRDRASLPTERESSDQLSDTNAPTDGSIGNSRIHRENGESRAEKPTTGDSEQSRTSSDSDLRQTVERTRATEIIEDSRAREPETLHDKQLAANKQVVTHFGEKDNIKHALPALFEGQIDDVYKAEQRFFNDDKQGILFTNGTGTGKTGTGSGVIRRFVSNGKDNIIAVVPNDKIARDWVSFLNDRLDVPAKQLDGITDNGKKGVVVTTYANFGNNDALSKRNWDLVVTDESHYLSSDEQGNVTSYLHKLRLLTGHYAGEYNFAKSYFSDEYKTYSDKLISIKNKQKKLNYDQHKEQIDKLIAQSNRLHGEWQQKEEKAKEIYKEKPKSKVLMLSATPFAYVKNVDYAEGYLFNYDNVSASDAQGYNAGNGRERFFMEHFGYRMRYNKLTRPDGKVNGELMEQQFNEWLKKQGALSGRRLDIPYDYDRKFFITEDAVGTKLDNAFEEIWDAKGQDDTLNDVPALHKLFPYHERMYLLEAIKAKHAVDYIKDNIKLGRKVVVFHDFNKGGASNPYQVILSNIKDSSQKNKIAAILDQPHLRADFRDLISPIDRFSRDFENTLFINGTLSKSKRERNVALFNQDDSGYNLLVVQSDAGREGISMHDTSGKHQRVLINLGLPTRPVAATQIEGRIYRTGQASNAIFRYFTTGTGWESSAFTHKIAQRASTAENLALGLEARGLKQSFLDAYANASDIEIAENDGVGGKVFDQEAAKVITGYDAAKAYYYGQQKNTKRRDQREGFDYYATPEPVGYKMVEWADVTLGDKILEPSAGHGAIARFIADGVDATAIEPSYKLSNRIGLSRASTSIINDRFENHNIINKYDAIVMNPPYGTGGKTAMEHLEKALRHLNKNGRVVALVPTGQFDKRFDSFLESKDASDINIKARILLPSITFENAGTSVSTQILVIDNNNLDQGSSYLDFRNAKDINELFDRLENIELRPRARDNSITLTDLETQGHEPIVKKDNEGKAQLVEHTTKRDKVIRGVIANLSYKEAKAIDKYTFKKDGGFFIREEYLDENNQPKIDQQYFRQLATQGIKADKLQVTIEQHIKQWRNKPAVEIVQSINQLPGEILDKVIADQAHDISGIHHNGHVYLIADNIESTAHALLVTEHEILGHYGLRGLFGNNLNPLLNNIYTTNKTIKSQADQLTKQYGYNKLLATEEILANMATTGDIQIMPFWNKLVAAFRNFSRKLGLPIDWTTNDIAYLLSNARSFVEKEPQHAVNTDGQQYSRLSQYMDAGLNWLDRKLDKSEIVSERVTDEQRAIMQQKLGMFQHQSIKQKIEEISHHLGKKLEQGIFDSFAPLKNLNETAYMQAHLSKGTEGAVEALLRFGKPKLTQGAIDIDSDGRGLFGVLSALNSHGTNELNEWLSWMAANRAEILKNQGRENLFTEQDIKTLKKLNEGNMSDGRNRTEVYQQVRKEFMQYNKAVLDIAEKAGLIDKANRRTWENGFYLPFYRVADEDNHFSIGHANKMVGQKAFSQLKGGTKALDDLLVNIVSNWSHLLTASMKNQAGATSLKSAVTMGIADKLEKISDGEYINTTTDQFRKGGQNIVWVMEHGQQTYYQVNDPLVFDALNMINHKGWNNPLINTMGKFKKALTIGVTISPTFRARNLIRDTLQATAVSKLNYNPISNIIEGFNASKLGSETLNRLMAGGGAIRFGSMNDGNQGYQLRKLMQELNIKEDRILNTPEKVKHAFAEAWRWYKELGDRAETVNRAAIYQQAIAEGKTHLQASFEARDLMNFTSAGKWASVRFLSQVIPFFNARLQGMYKLGRAANNDYKRFGLVAGAVALASSLLYLLQKDDDDYKALPDWVRDTYWYVKLGDKALYIPKPFEIGSLGSIVERGLELALAGNDYNTKDFGHSVINILSDQLAMNPVPQFVKPAIEASFNYNSFTAMPIDNLGQQRMSAKDRYTASTSTGAIMAGSALNISPQRLEYLIRGYFGWLGTQALNVTDIAMRPLTDFPSNPNRDLSQVNNLFMLGDFIKNADIGAGSKYLTRFYDTQKQISEVYASLSNARKVGELEYAQELAKDDKLSLRGLYNNSATKINRINNHIRLIRADKLLSASDKLARVNTLQNQRNRLAKLTDEKARL